MRSVPQEEMDRSLDSFLPRRRPLGRGPYTVVMLFVMSDPAWATVPRLKQFVEPPMNQISTAEKEFGKRVRAYYYFTGLMNPQQEMGALGYEDQGYKYTQTFKKWF